MNSVKVVSDPAVRNGVCAALIFSTTFVGLWRKDGSQDVDGAIAINDNGNGGTKPNGKAGFGNWQRSVYPFVGTLLAPSRTSMEAMVDVNSTIDGTIHNAAPPTTPVAESSSTTPKATPVRTFVYDFVVVGNGNAGKSAVDALRKECPGAKIAVIDPIRPGNSDKHTEYWAYHATSFDTDRKTVIVADDALVNLRYNHALLVATGARGAPPPSSVFDESILSRVLEYRPTELSLHQRRPILPAETVRKVALSVVSDGSVIGVVGSGWEAIELATAAASKKRRSKVKAKPFLTFGSAGPLSHILPRYLSTELTRSLRDYGVDVRERSLVKYVAPKMVGDESKLEMHCGKSYDNMDTKRATVDLVVSKCGTVPPNQRKI